MTCVELPPCAVEVWRVLLWIWVWLGTLACAMVRSFLMWTVAVGRVGGPFMKPKGKAKPTPKGDAKPTLSGDAKASSRVKKEIRGKEDAKPGR